MRELLQQIESLYGPLADQHHESYTQLTYRSDRSQRVDCHMLAHDCGVAVASKGEVIEVRYMENVPRIVGAEKR